MCNKRAFTMAEVLIACVLLVVTMAGIVNLFVVGRQHLLRSRSRMGGGEIGKLFFDHLQMKVRQDQWNGSNCLQGNMADCGGATQVMDIAYNPQYIIGGTGVVPGCPLCSRISVRVGWTPPAP